MNTSKLEQNYLFLNGNEVLVDFDDVIGSFAEFICCEMNKVGSFAQITDYVDYHFGSYHDLNYEQFKEVVIESSAFKKLKPNHRAMKALELLRDKGYKVRIVTSRGDFPNAEQDTIGWLAQHSAHYDSLDIVRPSVENKSDVYKKYGEKNICLLVDDALHNLNDLIESGLDLVPICLDRPWNQDERFEHGKNRFSSLYHLAQALAPIQPC